MADLCDRFLAELDEQRQVDETELSLHLKQCRSCRQQAAADLSLRHAFRGVAQPALSPHFVPQLRRRILVNGNRATRASWPFLLLASYWIVACALSCWLAAQLAAPLAALDPAAAALVAAGLVLAVLPVAALARLFRVGVVELIVGTLDRAWSWAMLCSGRPRP